jgi:hypothetical protein
MWIFTPNNYLKAIKVLFGGLRSSQIICPKSLKFGQIIWEDLNSCLLTPFPTPTFLQKKLTLKYFTFFTFYITLATFYYFLNKKSTAFFVLFTFLYTKIRNTLYHINYFLLLFKKKNSLKKSLPNTLQASLEALICQISSS